MSLVKKICLAVAQVIQEHDQEISTSDVVGCLLSTGAAYSNKALGPEMTLRHLAHQMILVARGNADAMQWAIKSALTAWEAQKVQPDKVKDIEMIIKSPLN